MVLYIILEIFENLGSQMGIYIYIYTHTPLYFIVFARRRRKILSFLITENTISKGKSMKNDAESQKFRLRRHLIQTSTSHGGAKQGGI